MIRAKVLGQRSLAKRLKALERAQRTKLKDATAVSLAEVREAARQNIRAQTRAATSSGALARSVKVRTDPDGLGGSVGTDLPHGRFLEFGTRRMPARPWLQPAFESLKPRIRRRFQEAVKAANRSAARGGSGEGIDV